MGDRVRVVCLVDVARTRTPRCRRSQVRSLHIYFLREALSCPDSASLREGMEFAATDFLSSPPLRDLSRRRSLRALREFSLSSFSHRLETTSSMFDVRGERVTCPRGSPYGLTCSYRLVLLDRLYGASRTPWLAERHLASSPSRTVDVSTFCGPK